MALKYQPSNPYYLNNQGFAKIGLGKFGEAETLIKKSIELDSTNAFAYKNMAILMKKLNKSTESEQYLKKAKELDASIKL
jgi:Flp pilus assembly protein TadD